MDRFSNKQPGESYYIEFDFTNYVGLATVSSAVVTAKIVSTGVDATATITDAVKQLITSPSVFVWVMAGSDHVDYQITCVATCDDASVYEMEGLLLVAENPATAETAVTGPGIVVLPVLDPIPLEEFRLHCRVDNHDNDVLLVSAIKTATLNVEEITNRALLTQTWDYCLDSWPNKNYIRIPKGNLQSVTSIKYKDDAGTEYTLVAGTDYLVEKNGDQNGRIVLPYGKSWPSSTLYPSNPITVRYVCGWTEAMKVPYPLRTAVKMIGLDLYENGEAYICVQQPIIPNKAIDRLIASWRLWD